MSNLPELTGKALYEHLIANKSELIAKKKALPRKSDGIGGCPNYFDVKGTEVKKTSIGQIPDLAKQVRVSIVANTSLYRDSQKDVCLPDCWAKTIKEGAGRLHLKDHDYVMDSEIGDVVSIYSMDLPLSTFGINKQGTVQSLVYDSDVMKMYDEKTFTKYKNGRVQQHSIGLIYKDLRLAINDEDYKEEYAEYQKWIDSIINKEEVELDGFFWAVYQLKLIEVSAVVAASNILTPTLSVKSDTPNWPSPDTNEQPSKFDLSERLKGTTFFN